MEGGIGGSIAPITASTLLRQTCIGLRCSERWVSIVKNKHHFVEAVCNSDAINRTDLRRGKIGRYHREKHPVIAI